MIFLDIFHDTYTSRGNVFIREREREELINTVSTSRIVVLFPIKTLLFFSTVLRGRLLLALLRFLFCSARANGYRFNERVRSRVCFSINSIRRKTRLAAYRVPGVC